MAADCPRVWPISAGSWAFLNELRYLHLHENLLGEVTRIVFVLNSADFGSASIWSSEATHPTHYPMSGLLYLTRKFFFHESDASATSIDNDWRAELRYLLSVYRGPLTLVLYPNKVESKNDTVRKMNLDVHIPELRSDRITVLSLAEDPNWSPDYYRDDIHPTATGLRELATFIRANAPECDELQRHSSTP
ncbi:hypothetical protein XH91_27630 [Bradyrhizobium guangzhouense]|uniref:SGNH/GDSL hydrolase family protein n=1 Tax=Bradyrhizobium guangzhouense TaxID=1325095 RepID=A0AAE5X4V6_9BRAD|nr:hypothetical protein XH91_27630 [Bradyrhizobium guangzhouense]